MSDSQDSLDSFAAIVRTSFAFAERDANLTASRARATGGTDPRDVTLIVRYSRQDCRFDVAWNPVELSAAVLIRLTSADLPRTAQYVYLEPFVEFLTNFQEEAVVPYIREKMTFQQIQSVMDKRNVVFRSGLPAIIESLGEKMRNYLDPILSAPPEQVRAYHQWMSR